MSVLNSTEYHEVPWNWALSKCSRNPFHRKTLLINQPKDNQIFQVVGCWHVTLIVWKENKRKCDKLSANLWIFKAIICGFQNTGKTTIKVNTTYEVVVQIKLLYDCYNTLNNFIPITNVKFPSSRVFLNAFNMLDL